MTSPITDPNATAYVRQIPFAGRSIRCALDRYQQYILFFDNSLLLRCTILRYRYDMALYRDIDMSRQLLSLGWGSCRMPRKHRNSAAFLMNSNDQGAQFHPADILFVLEWASVAPGLGGWNVLLDNEAETRKVSVVPPGAESPAFFITRVGSEVALHRYNPGTKQAHLVEFARYSSLREAIQAVCSLSWRRDRSDQ